MAELVLEQLHKSYGGRIAVASIDLKIPTGSFCIFLGPSGCGKSTTLNCVAGLEELTSGRISLGGRNITNLQPHQRDIAMVFQSALLYPHLTAHDNIRMSLRASPIDRDEAESKIARAAKMLDIASLLGKKPPAMSGESGSASRSRKPSSAIPPHSCSTNHCPRSMRRCASHCAPNSSTCKSDLA